MITNFKETIVMPIAVLVFFLRYLCFSKIQITMACLGIFFCIIYIIFRTSIKENIGVGFFLQIALINVPKNDTPYLAFKDLITPWPYPWTAILR